MEAIKARSHNCRGTTDARLLRFFATAIGCLSIFATATASKHEQRLIRHLTKNYNPEIRPVKHLNETTEVAFEAEMIQLISVKERDQVMWERRKHRQGHIGFGVNVVETGRGE